MTLLLSGGLDTTEKIFDFGVDITGYSMLVIEAMQANVTLGTITIFPNHYLSIRSHIIDTVELGRVSLVFYTNTAVTAKCQLLSGWLVVTGFKL